MLDLFKLCTCMYVYSYTHTDMMRICSHITAQTVCACACASRYNAWYIHITLWDRVCAMLLFISHFHNGYSHVVGRRGDLTVCVCASLLPMMYADITHLGSVCVMILCRIHRYYTCRVCMYNVTVVWYIDITLFDCCVCAILLSMIYG